MHAVIRRYRVRLGTVQQAIRYAEKEFIPLARRIPGFVACYLLDAGNDVLASIGLFQTQEGAESGVRLQREWFRDEWSSFRPLPPEVVAGEVFAQATAERDPLADRRRQPDRRRQAMLIPGDAWTGVEQRSGGDRRVQFAPQVDELQTVGGWRAAG